MSFRLDQRAFGYKGLLRAIRGFVGGFPQLIDTGPEIRQGAPGASPFPTSVGSGEVFIAPGPLAQTGRLRATVLVGGGNDVAQFSLAYVGQGSPPGPLSPDFQSPVFPSFSQTLVAGQELLENDIFLVITSAVDWVEGNVVDMDIVPTTNTVPWVERRWFADEFNSPNFSGDIEWITQGPGDTSPTARITVGITSFTSGAIKDFNVFSFDGYSDTSPFTASGSQPNRAGTQVHLDEQAMDYHITINARRFIVGIRLQSGVWQSLYLGFFVPYAGTVSYPYPILTGGTDTVNDVPSSVSNTHSSWWDPQDDSGGGFGSLRIRTPAGGYQNFWNIENGVVSDSSIDNVVWPYGQTSQVNSAEFHNTTLGAMARTPVFRLGTSPDPDLRAYNLLQTVLFSVDFSGGISQTLGFLDGVFQITTEANAGGNTFVLESPEVTYLVLQNVFRTARRDMVAIRMDP